MSDWPSSGSASPAVRLLRSVRTTKRVLDGASDSDTGSPAMTASPSIKLPTVISPKAIGRPGPSIFSRPGLAVHGADRGGPPSRRPARGRATGGLGMHTRPPPAVRAGKSHAPMQPGPEAPPFQPPDRLLE